MTYILAEYDFYTGHDFTKIVFLQFSATHKIFILINFYYKQKTKTHMHIIAAAVATERRELNEKRT